MPITGVVIASIIWIKSIINPVQYAGFLLSTTTTSTKKYRQKLYPNDADKSFKTWPTAYPQKFVVVRSSYFSSNVWTDGKLFDSF